MRKSNLYYALILKFGTMETAAKALMVKPKTLDRYANDVGKTPLRFIEKAVKALGIENPDLIQFLFFPCC